MKIIGILLSAIILQIALRFLGITVVKIIVKNIMAVSIVLVLIGLFFFYKDFDFAKNIDQLIPFTQSKLKMMIHWIFNHAWDASHDTVNELKNK